MLMQAPRDPDQDNPHRRMGLSMSLAAWVVLLLLATLMFNNILGEQRNPNRHIQGRVLDNGVHETIINRNHFGHYVTSGAINEQAVVFLLDTGASDVSVPASVAEALGLKRGVEVLYQTANGTITGYATTLDSVRIGTITLHNVRASINPYMEGDEVLLGMSFLRHLELVQRNDTLTLRLYPNPITNTGVK